MVGAASAVAGLSIGREALKGITQPDTRPTSNLANRKGDKAQRDKLVILKEEDILASVKAQMGTNLRDTTKLGANSAPSPSNPKPTPEVKASGLPVSVQSQGILLEVVSAKQQGDDLVLNLTLRNKGSRTVRFLSSFLDVTDDAGRLINARVEGLPNDLPPSEETASSTVIISLAVLEEAKKLTITLTDYPDQQLQLKLPGVPVTF
jgi:uncharacterized protein affecting Mg2+/Co2+ transport